MDNVMITWFSPYLRCGIVTNPQTLLPSFCIDQWFPQDDVWYLRSVAGYGEQFANVCDTCTLLSSMLWLTKVSRPKALLRGCELINCWLGSAEPQTVIRRNIKIPIIALWNFSTQNDWIIVKLPRMTTDFQPNRHLWCYDTYYRLLLTIQYSRSIFNIFWKPVLPNYSAKTAKRVSSFKSDLSHVRHENITSRIILLKVFGKFSSLNF